MIALREILREIRRDLADRRSARECARIARLFNDRFTYRHRYVKNLPPLPGEALFGMLPPGGNAWMCPTCNRIHLAESCSAIGGLQFPGCCKTPQGHRLYSGARMP